jgi:hypothetical protein
MGWSGVLVLLVLVALFLLMVVVGGLVTLSLG